MLDDHPILPPKMFKPYYKIVATCGCRIERWKIMQCSYSFQFLVRNNVFMTQMLEELNTLLPIVA